MSFTSQLQENQTYAILCDEEALFIVTFKTSWVDWHHYYLFIFLKVVFIIELFYHLYHNTYMFNVSKLYCFLQE